MENTSKRSTEGFKLSKVARLSALTTFLVAYTHFFGLSYRKSYLEGAGFEALNINLSPDESIFYAIYGLKGAIGRLINLDIIFHPTQLVAGIIFTFFFLLIWYIKKKEKNGLDSNLSFHDRLHNFIDRMTNSIWKALLLSVYSFVITYVFQLLLTLAFVVLLVTLWLIMALGIAAGLEDGKSRVIDPVCKNFSWENADNDRILGCRRIMLLSGKELKGIYVHRGSDINYVLTNEAAYELNNKKEIISYRPIHVRPENKSTSNEE